MGTSAADWREGVPEFPAQDVTLMRLVRVASQGITAFTDPVLRPTGLTESSYHTLILVMAAGAGGTTPTALCEQVGQNRANMTRIVELLASEKLVQIKADARDARRRRVAISEAGRKLVRGYAALFEPIVTVAFGSLSVGDKKILERLLRTLIRSMDAAEHMATKHA
ncbi:MAG: MarR family winged helix-turn-helix transcriptional regulator [Rhodoglobus sp.]|nr:MarR family winged helix-turn-helix transcriptional regulator [Rhodoglobus sp.]